MLANQVEQVLADVNAFVFETNQVFADVLLVSTKLCGAVGFLCRPPCDSAEADGILVCNLEEIAFIDCQIFIGIFRFEVRLENIDHVVILFTLLGDTRK